jgi:hypothetical protein
MAITKNNGCKFFCFLSITIGYSSHLTCLGPVHWHEKLQTDNLAPFRCSLTPTIIVAVDAIHYKSKKHSFDQYKKSHFMRDLQKLYSACKNTTVGFPSHSF